MKILKEFIFVFVIIMICSGCYESYTMRNPPPNKDASNIEQAEYYIERSKIGTTPRSDMEMARLYLQKEAIEKGIFIEIKR